MVIAHYIDSARSSINTSESECPRRGFFLFFFYSVAVGTDLVRDGQCTVRDSYVHVPPPGVCEGCAQ